MNAKQRRKQRRQPTAVVVCKHCYHQTYVRKYCPICGGKL